MNELLQRAVDHHTKSLMKFGGWLPWQKLIQNRRQQEQTACAAFRKCFLRSANSYPFIVHTVTFCRFVQNTVRGAVKFDNWKNLETVNLRQGGWYCKIRWIIPFCCGVIIVFKNSWIRMWIGSPPKLNGLLLLDIPLLPQTNVENSSTIWIIGNIRRKGQFNEFCYLSHSTVKIPF